MSANAWHRRRVNKNRRRHDLLVLNSLPLFDAIRAMNEFEIKSKSKFKWRPKYVKQRQEERARQEGV